MSFPYLSTSSSISTPARVLLDVQCSTIANIDDSKVRRQFWFANGGNYDVNQSFSLQPLAQRLISPFRLVLSAVSSNAPVSLLWPFTTYHFPPFTHLLCDWGDVDTIICFARLWTASQWFIESMHELCAERKRQLKWRGRQGAVVVTRPQVQGSTCLAAADNWANRRCPLAVHCVCECFVRWRISRRIRWRTSALHSLFVSVYGQT